MIQLYWLIAAHFLGDFPLQGDFLAQAKNPNSPFGMGGVWIWAMLAHCAIQGAGVALVTGSVSLGLAETGAHAVIDYGKCKGWFGFHADQFLHLACRVVWWTARN